MPKYTDLPSLTALFQKLGATDPESWAGSQIREGIPQLTRYIFLRQAWSCIVSEDDPTWIKDEIAHSEQRPDEPYAGVGHALKSLRSRGATDDEITDLVRGMQAELLFRLCHLLEDPGTLEPEIEDMSWVLAELDNDGNPIHPIQGLHESVLETDPTGREMRPRNRRPVD